MGAVKRPRRSGSDKVRHRGVACQVVCRLIWGAVLTAVYWLVTACSCMCLLLADSRRARPEAALVCVPRRGIRILRRVGAAPLAPATGPLPRAKEVPT